MRIKRRSLPSRPLRAAALCIALTAAAATSQAQGGGQGSTIAMQGNGKGATACASCHGAHGEGNPAAGFPRLAGVSAPYIESQLALFADGQRQNPVMQPIAKALSEAERTAVGHYFSDLPFPPPAAKDESPTPAQTGAWLAARGRWADGLPACVQCHGPGGAGVGSAFPPLAGQSAAYIAAQLHAFKSGARPGGPMNLMKVVASKLSDTDISAVADYYGSTDGGRK